MARRSVEKVVRKRRFDGRVWKVLLVDEDFSYLQCQAHLLRRHGFDVQACASYDEGSASLASRDFDLIIVSQGGVEFEGRIVLEHVVEAGCRTPVLVSARHADVSCYLEAMSMGAADYLEKPLMASDLEKMKLRFLQPPLGTA